MAQQRDLKHSHVVQKEIRSSQLESAAKIMNEESYDGCTPMVLTVQGGGSSDCCCCTCKLNVPSGLHVLEQHWGRDSGRMSAGVHWCYCYNKRIVYVLPIGGIFYDAPVRNCPTMDNVKVGFDLSLMLKLVNGDQDLHRFIYTLGVTMFDELLSAELEEAIRNYIHSYKHDKSNLAEALKEDLNSKFKSFGVGVEQVNVKGVIMPPLIAESLKEATENKNKIKNEIKKQENEILRATNQDDQEFTQLQKRNLKHLELMRAENRQKIMEREAKIIQAQTNLSTSKVEYEMRANDLKTREKGVRNAIEDKAQRSVVEIVNRARAEGEAKRIELKQKLVAANIEADALVDSTKAKCDAIMEEAKAEQKIAQAIQAKRNYEYEMAKAEVLEKISKSGNVVMSGNTGEALFQNIVSALKKQN